MKHTYAFLLALLGAGAVNAQCTTWVNPEPGGGWNDFTGMFGGAPCDDGSGCPVNEISDFQVWADEAYQMDGVAQGGVYTFSACNGAGGTAWDLSFTVIAPSGAIDASGLDAGSVCALTFTASETGDYLIVVSEAGVACGASTNQDTDNGFPTMTCATGVTLCNGIGIHEVSADNGLQVGPNPSTGIFNFTVKGTLTTLEVFDMNGRRLNGVSGISNGTGAYVLDLSSYDNGSYVVRATVNGQRVTERLTLAH